MNRTIAAATAGAAARASAGCGSGERRRRTAGDRPRPIEVRAQVREVAVVGDHFAFAPARIEVQKDDLVQIKFTAEGHRAQLHDRCPYRISKRAGAGQSIVFEFRADEAGRFPFYCNLTQDDRCKQMKGELVVR